MNHHFTVFLSCYKVQLSRVGPPFIFTRKHKSSQFDRVRDLLCLEKESFESQEGMAIRKKSRTTIQIVKTPETIPLSVGPLLGLYGLQKLLFRLRP